MRTEWLLMLKRVLLNAVGLVLAVGLMIRANTFDEPVPGMIGPVMCVLCGLLLLGTTFAMSLKTVDESAVA